MRHSLPIAPQFYVTAPQPCPYLPGLSERKLFTALTGDGARVLNDTLSKQGFRRSQNVLYRPACSDCAACLSARIRVADHQPGRGHRRILRRNAHLQREATSPWATEDQFALFRRYLDRRHADGGMADMDIFEFAAMIEETPVRSRVIEYVARPGTDAAGSQTTGGQTAGTPTAGHQTAGQQTAGDWATGRAPVGTHMTGGRMAGDHPPRGHDAGGRQLAAVCLTDVLDDGLSLVYSFYDPDLQAQSLGTYMILDHIELARQVGLPYVYLGYWVPGSAKMAYKSRFDALEVFQGGVWKDIALADVPPRRPHPLSVPPITEQVAAISLPPADAT